MAKLIFSIWVLNSINQQLSGDEICSNTKNQKIELSDKKMHPARVFTKRKSVTDFNGIISVFNEHFTYL